MTVVIVNGEPREVDERATVDDVVRVLGPPDGRGVAVALDGEVVPRGEWSSTVVRDGQQVEVLHAVQGGS